VKYNDEKAIYVQRIAEGLYTDNRDTLAGSSAANEVVARSSSVCNGTSILAAGVDNNTIGTRGAWEILSVMVSISQCSMTYLQCRHRWS
jgi:hypothetical protein